MHTLHTSTSGLTRDYIAPYIILLSRMRQCHYCRVRSNRFKYFILSEPRALDVNSYKPYRLRRTPASGGFSMFQSPFSRANSKPLRENSYKYRVL